MLNEENLFPSLRSRVLRNCFIISPHVESGQVAETKQSYSHFFSGILTSEGCNEMLSFLPVYTFLLLNNPRSIFVMNNYYQYSTETNSSLTILLTLYLFELA